MNSKFFKVEELQCKCCKACNMEQAFLNRLDMLRVAFGGPMIITSGYRCKSYNDKVKGSKNSQHMLGRAVDVAIAESDKRHKLVACATQLGFSVGIDGSFVHVDSREGTKVMFLYPQHA